MNLLNIVLYFQKSSVDIKSSDQTFGAIKISKLSLPTCAIFPPLISDLKEIRLDMRLPRNLVSLCAAVRCLRLRLVGKNPRAPRRDNFFLFVFPFWGKKEDGATVQLPRAPTNQLTRLSRPIHV